MENYLSLQGVGRYLGHFSPLLRQYQETFYIIFLSTYKLLLLYLVKVSNIVVGTLD